MSGNVSIHVLRLQLVIPKVRLIRRFVDSEGSLSEGPLFRRFVNPKMKIRFVNPEIK